MGGLPGGDDPLNRATFDWKLVCQDNDFLAHTKRMIEMRKRLRGLRIGDYRALRTQKLMGFVRMTDRVQDTVVVLVTPSDEPVEEMVVIPDSRILGYTLFREEFTQKEVRIWGA